MPKRADAIFTKLMGDEVDLRKSFIQSRAKVVKPRGFGYLVMDDEITDVNNTTPIEDEVIIPQTHSRLVENRIR